MRYAATVRQWRLLRLIRGSRYITVAKAAKELQVSTKTIRRYLTALEAAGFPLYREDQEGSGYFLRIAKDWFLEGRN